MENSQDSSHQNTSQQPAPAQGAAANPLQEAMMTHLLAENAFLRAQVEQHARAEAELRAALRETVRAMPKAITTGQGEDHAEIETGNMEAGKVEAARRIHNPTARIEERIAASTPASAPTNNPQTAAPQRSTPQPHIPPSSTPARSHEPATKPNVGAVEKAVAASAVEKPRREARPLVAPPLTQSDVYVPRHDSGQPVALQSAMNELSRRRNHRPLWKKMLGMR